MISSRRHRTCGFPLPASPVRPGESHVGRENKLLFCRGKWILKMVPVAKGAIDEELRGLFFGLAGSAGPERAARSERAVVHRPAVDAVRGDQLCRHGAVCPDQGVLAEAGPDAALRAAQ